MGDGTIFIGKGETAQGLRLDRANRHGVIAGATGTGKTVTLQVLAEGFAAAGVPVFAADVKGDLSGIAAAGTPNDKMLARAQSMDLTITPRGAPAICWDVNGKEGHPVRATVSEMGPVLLARLLQLSEAQEGVLNIAFHVADKEGLLLLDLDDLQAMLANLSERSAEIGREYGNVAPATVGAIQRELLTLRNQGAAEFFGEPALKLADLMRVGLDGRGYVNLLAADKLIQNPRLYSTFLLWLLSELFEELPEVGDPEKPKLVFFFDEAHLLFNDAPKPLLEKIEQVVRLIRSKGVGVYFCTQSPADIPDTVLAQLGNRIQHALRAYTPSDQQGLKAAAMSFRANPAFDTAKAIQDLGVGEALVSILDERGAPTVVQRTLIRPPDSRIGPLQPGEREQVMSTSPVRGVYDVAVNRESAFEILWARHQQADAAAKQQADAAAQAKVQAQQQRQAQPRASNRQSVGEAMVKSVVRGMSSSIGRQIGQALIRGVLGSLSRRR